MVERGDDFDDAHDEEWNSPLLPPDDRLWRHPSEMGENSLRVSPEALSARRSWLAATPSRAGAWSAGLVGALLAAGVVLIGGHLTHVLPTSPPSAASGSHPAAIDPRSTLDATTTTTLSLEQALIRVAGKISPAMPMVFVDHRQSGVGVVVNSKGYVLVPASLITDIDDIGLYIGGQLLPATLVGEDPGTGLAVVHVRASSLTPVRFVASSAMGYGAIVALVWVDGAGSHICMGTVSQLGVSLGTGDDSPPILTSLESLDPAQTMSAGGVVVDGAGRVIGMITNVAGKTLIATPGWLANVVSADLISSGRVSHGWLGIMAETATVSNSETAVKVISVNRGGAAARAGVRAGDIIEAVDGQPVHSMAEMVGQLYSLPPHTSVVLNLDRGGHMLDATAKLAAAA